MRKQGIVDAIEQKTTKTGKTYHRVQVNGVWYGLWKHPGFTQGQTIEFDELIQGDFKNMANVEVSGGASQSTSSAAPPVGSGLRSEPERQTLIMRQNATTSAIALLATSKIAGKQDVASLLELVRETAQRIFDMNVNGYSPAATTTTATAPGEKEVGADVLFQP